MVRVQRYVPFIPSRPPYSTSGADTRADAHVVRREDPARVVTSAAYILFYRRRSPDHAPLGGPAFEDLFPSAGDTDMLHPDKAHAQAGEGRRLDDSSRNGSSSASPAAAAIHPAGGGGCSPAASPARAAAHHSNSSNKHHKAGRKPKGPRIRKVVHDDDDDAAVDLHNPADDEEDEELPGYSERDPRGLADDDADAVPDDRMDTDDDAGRYHTILSARQETWRGFGHLTDEADADAEDPDDGAADADDDHDHDGRLPNTKLSAMALQSLRAHEATLRGGDDADDDDVSSTGAADGDLDERDSLASGGHGRGRGDGDGGIGGFGYYGAAGGGVDDMAALAPGPGTPEGSLQGDMDAQVPMLFASGEDGSVLGRHGEGEGEPMEEDEREGEVAEIKLSEGE